MEVDEGLKVGGDELIDDKDAEDDHEEHEGYGHLREPEAVAAFEALGQPVDDHAHEEGDEDDGIVVEDVRNLLPVPLTTDAFDHLRGGTPGDLVGFGRVEIGAAAEEESREADEEEGEEDVPHFVGAAVEEGLAALAMDGATDDAPEFEKDDAGSDDHEGKVEHGEYGTGVVEVGEVDGSIEREDDEDAQEGLGFLPVLID